MPANARSPRPKSDEPETRNITSVRSVENSMPRCRTTVVLLALALLPAIKLSAQPVAQPASVKNDYTKPDAWLCRPGLNGAQNACAVELASTVITAEGRL